MYLILHSLDVEDYIIFFGLIPIAFIYLINFIFLHRISSKNDYFKNEFVVAEFTEDDRVETDNIDYGTNPNHVNDSSNFSAISCPTDLDKSPVSLQKQTAFEGYKTDPFNHIWIFWLYFFEYCAITGFLDRLAQLRESDQSDDFFEKNLFTITQFLYQAGVLVARSSLPCLKLKVTGTVSFIMLVHFCVLFAFCLWYVDVSRWIIFVISLSLGMFGGWGYLFSYYRLMDNKKVSESNREKLINYLAVSADIGALCATLFAILVSNTILKVD